MKTYHPSISQFQQHVELKDYRPHRPPTKKEYVRLVCKLAEHFQCDPATLRENQLRQYFLFLRQRSRRALELARHSSTYGSGHKLRHRQL